MATTRASARLASRRQVLSITGGMVAAALTATSCDVLSTDPDSERGAEQEGGRKGKEAPMLAERVKAGDLPPVAQRLPKDPLVVEPADSIGRYGGTWQSWFQGAGALYMIQTQIGYETMVRWNPDWTDIVPNIVKSWEINQDGAEYVFTLQEGVKWSDGEPFTADDLVFAYDDILLDTELNPAGPSESYTVQQTPAELEKIDDYTVRFTFSTSNGLFLDKLAGPGRQIIAPRHYLEQFHKKYNSDADQLAKDEGFGSWVELFQAKNDVDQWQNPERPVLDAWVVVTPPGEGASRAEFERNPYYWKVDPDGSQLPYLDRVSYELIEEPETALLKTTNGEIDFNHPTFSASIGTPANKPVLARSRESGNYEFVDSTSASMNQMIIAFNLTHEDEKMREVFQNKLFRIGLSYAINRQDLVDTVFQRQGEPWQAAPHPDSDYYHEELAKQHLDYDVDQANTYLDDAGYAERDGDGFRLRPDGERLSFAVEVVTEEPEQIRALELVKQNWNDVGIDMQVKPEDRTLFGERVYNANLHDALVWTGDGGFGMDPILTPVWYFPYGPGAPQAVAWGTWYTTGGADGEEPPEAAKQQMKLYDELVGAVDEDERRELFMQILDIAKEEFWVIGTVLDEGVYGTVKKDFHNVPTWMPAAWVYPTPGPTRPEQYYKSGGQ